MSSYTVGTNKPIKIKVSASAAGHAATAFFLNNPDVPDSYLRAESNASFSNSNAARWRNVNSGKSVKGRTVWVRTILDFPQGFQDKNSYNRAVDQAKRLYKVELSGGTPANISVTFQVKNNVQDEIVVFNSYITLT